MHGTNIKLDRPVSTSSNRLFEGFPSRLRPFGLEFSIILGVRLLFILVTCRSLFDLYLFSFSSAGCSLSSSKISSFLLWSKVYLAVLKNFISTDASHFILFSKGSNFAAMYKNGESQCIMYLFLQISGPKWACRLEVPVFEIILLVFVEYRFHFHKLHNRDI
jgi:hypothetical protein